MSTRRNNDVVPRNIVVAYHRPNLDRMMIENGFMQDRWNHDSITLADGQSIAVRIHGENRARKLLPLVLHLHGGAFRDGSLATASPVPSILAASGAVVVSASYPCGKSHPFPEAIECMFFLLEQLARERSRWVDKRSGLFVAGEEAGGNLAAALALMARDRQTPHLSGQILLSPMLDPSLSSCSIRGAQAGQAGCKWADGWQDYLGSPEKGAHPYAAPSVTSRLAGLAPALILTAQDDPLHDETQRYLQRLRDCGVVVQASTLAAPSGWPEALCGLKQGATDWKSQLRIAAQDFFAAIAVARLTKSTRSDKRLPA